MAIAKFDARKWSWIEEGSDKASGPFETKGHALSDAIDALCNDHSGEHVEILVGRCEKIDPVKLARNGADYDRDFLNDLEENVASELPWYDDEVLVVPVAEKKAAQTMWENLVALWVRTFVICDVWDLVDEKKETIYIPEDEESLCPSCYGEGTCMVTNEPDSVTCEICKGKGYIPDKKKHLLDLKLAINQVRQDRKVVCHICHGKGYVSGPDGGTLFACPNCMPLTEGEHVLTEAPDHPPVEHLKPTNVELQAKLDPLNDKDKYPHPDCPKGCQKLCRGPGPADNCWLYKKSLEKK